MKNLKPYPNYKDSNVEWLGDVPEHWEVLVTKRFHETEKYLNTKNECDNILSLTLRGVVNNNIDSPEGLIPKDYRTYQIFQKNDLVFKLIDLENLKTSRVGLVFEKGIMSSAYIRLIIGDNSHPKYMYYYYYSLYLNHVYNNIGSGVRSTLNPSDLLNLICINPPKTEQTAIANYLDRKTAQIDEAIAQKERLIELLKERQQIVIHQAVTQGLDSSVEMKDSGVEDLGKIPIHWKLIKFKHIIRTKARLGWKGLKASEYVDKSNYGFLSTPNIKTLNIDFDNAYFISKKRYYESPEIMLEKDDVLLVKDGSTLGIVNIVKKLPFLCTVNSSIAVLRIIDKKTLNANYLQYFLKSSYLQKVISLKKGGMGVPHLFQSDINNFILTIPTINEQLQIVSYINNQTTKIQKSIAQQTALIEKLKEYKTVLIDAAVTGKVRVES